MGQTGPGHPAKSANRKSKPDMNTETQASHDAKDHDHKPHEIVFYVDKQRFVTDQPNQTPRSILQFFAGDNPDETTLVLKEGKEPHKFTNPDEPIVITDGMRFVVFHNTPCPVS
jgi:hypothetical protein